ncbi:TolC family protein [Campylobacter concisus]|jgi:putative outer membrane component of efflux system|uniref:TolC family protein n=1 Tax=Campylobacter concisus TaxID=199 RepID=UPI000CD8A1A9|nr:TolC family protein [Campylobacter concisus]QPH88241.1 TolC family protein [Campylobacter concisus]QPI03187.1 TolC family protein [Campylobacter concisus]
MKKFLFIFLPIFLLGSNLSMIANKAMQNEISKIKELELKRAKLSDEATLSSYMPSLSLEGSYGKNASTFPSVVAKESAGVLARIDFLLYDGGAREARLKMSQLLKNKAMIASDEAKNYLALKAVNLYFNALALENIIAAKNAQANFLKGVLDKLEKTNIAGLAAKDELENVRAKYYLANSTQLEYKNKMEQILNEINLLTGEKILPVAGAKMADISSNLASKNAELDRLSQDIFLGEAKLGEAKAGFLPQILLYDTYGFYKNNYDINLGRFSSYRSYVDKYLKEDTHGNKFGIAFKWKIFDFFATSKMSQAQKIALDEARLNVEYKKRENETRLKNLQSEIVVLTSKIASLNEYVRASDLALKASYEKYNSGLLGYSDLLEALSQKFDAISLFESAKDELEIKKAEFFFENGEPILERIRD